MTAGNTSAFAGYAIRGLRFENFLERDPFSQNVRAEVRKFLDVEWIATGPKAERSRSIKLTSVFHASVPGYY